MLSYLKIKDLRIDDHHLTDLTMRPGRAIQKHRLGASYWHVECPDVLLAIFEGNVPAVDGFRLGLLKWLTSCVLSTLSDGVIAVAELKLHDISDICSHQVWYKEILGTANHHGDEPISSSLYGGISSDY